LNRSLEHWRWQFERNPYGGPFASEARLRHDDTLVGVHSVMPFQLCVDGRPVRAAQTLDLVVDARYRRQGIFESAGRDCMEWLRESGFEAVDAFPNASSYPGFVRSLGWKHILHPRSYMLQLDVGDVIQRKLHNRAVAGLAQSAYRLWRLPTLRSRASNAIAATPEARHEAFDAMPDGYEELWDAWRMHPQVSVWKDSQYLKWRYDDNPDHEFRYHVLTRGGRTVALAVTVEIERQTSICEMIVEKQDGLLARRLIAEIIRSTLESNGRAVRFLGRDSGFFDQVFEGFQVREATANVLVGRALADPALDDWIGRAEHWSIMFGDADFV
jgi:hypothetical protein